MGDIPKPDADAQGAAPDRRGENTRTIRRARAADMDVKELRRRGIRPWGRNQPDSWAPP